jgi:parallel beta-helix repeat protein
MNKKVSLLKTCVAVSIANMISVPALAATITVTSASDVDNTGCTLREAIISLNSEALEVGCTNSGGSFGAVDNIVFDAMTFPAAVTTSITLDGTKGPLSFTAGKIVAINGLGAEVIAVDGNNGTRVFDVSGGIVNISNITITGGSAATQGGAVLVSGGSLGLANTNVTANQADGSGGGVVLQGTSTASLTNVNISGNSATGQGLVNTHPTGGLKIEDSASAWVSESTVSQNTMTGISVSASGRLTLLDSEVSQNTGTGIVLHGTSEPNASPTEPVSFCTVTLRNSKISDNVGSGISSYYCHMAMENLIVSDNDQSGVLATSANTITLQNSEISNNGAGGIIGAGRSSASTGGLYPAAPVRMFVKNTTVSGNKSNGGIDITIGSLDLTSSTVSKNEASRGGGLRVGDQGNVQMVNTILSGNTAPNPGAEVYMFSYASFTSLGSNTLGTAAKPYSETVAGPAADQFGLIGDDFDMTTDGQFATLSEALMATLSDNGCQTPVGVSGSKVCTRTHGLVVESLALDTANATYCGTGTDVTTDQRGEPRITGICDIGAFEGFSNFTQANEQVLKVVIPVKGKAVSFEL